MKKNSDFVTVSTVTGIISWILILGLSFLYSTKIEVMILIILLGTSALLYFINTRKQNQSKLIAFYGILLNLSIFIISTNLISRIQLGSIFIHLPLMEVLFWIFKVLIIVLNFALLFRASIEIWFGKLKTILGNF